MHLNIIRTKAVNELLKGLGQDYVFVGGAVVSLYASRSTADVLIRPTDDVDVIVELASYGGYSKLDERLRELGFKNDITSGVICRYQVQGITVDVMPTDPAAIGFSNRWYPEGFQTAISHQIDKDTAVNIFTLPYFIASKWEAFKGRGVDYRSSTDFEDLVYIFENAENFEAQMRGAPEHLIAYLNAEFGAVLDSEDFEEGLASHMAGGYHSPAPTEIISMLRDSFGIDPPYLGYSR
jgi:hypothetical protein